MAHPTPVVPASILCAELSDTLTTYQATVPVPLTEIAATEGEFAASGTLGFVDFSTGVVVVQQDDWQDFTRRFMEFCAQFSFDRSYCALAAAIAKADGYKHGFDSYIPFALSLQTHYFEFEEGV
jgi:hypothetical protein